MPFLSSSVQSYVIGSTCSTAVRVFSWSDKRTSPDRSKLRSFPYMSLRYAALRIGTYLLTYLLITYLLHGADGLQLVKKFPTFYGTRRFITALTSVRHLSLSWASPIHYTYPHPTSWRPILILSTHLRLGLPSGLFPSGFLTKTLYTPSPHPYAPHAQPISFFSILLPATYWYTLCISYLTYFSPKLKIPYLVSGYKTRYFCF